MTNLNDVVGSLINQIERGRAQADMGTIEIADIYRKTPLLSNFPVPKIVLDQIVIDLKVAVGSIPASGNYLSSATRSKAIEMIGENVSDLHLRDKSLKSMFASDPTLTQSWINSKNDLQKKVAECLPEDGNVNLDLIAQNIGTVIRGNIIDLITTPGSKIAKSRLHKQVTESIPEVEKRVIDNVRGTLIGLLKEQPPSSNDISVLVTASELEAIPPEKVTTLRLTFSESDRAWTKIEDQGETKLKLVPY